MTHVLGVANFSGGDRRCGDTILTERPSMVVGAEEGSD